jgi:hypothetical protein
MNQDVGVYFLHIPRTSGRATHRDLYNSGVSLSTPSLDDYLSKNEWGNNSLLCGHFGNHPIKKNDNDKKLLQELLPNHNRTIKTFTIVRDPVSHTASMSVFAPEGVSRMEFAKMLIYGEPSNRFPFVANPQSSFISSDISFAEKGTWGEYELPRISFSNSAQEVLDVVNFADSNGIQIYSLENRHIFLQKIAECFDIHFVEVDHFPKETNAEIEEFCMDNSEAILQKHHIDYGLHSLAVLGL